MWSLLLYLGGPVFLAAVFWRVEMAALARKRALLSRAPSAASDVAELKVRVVEGSGQRVSLGSSVETPESVSAKPTLTSGEVLLVEEAFDEADGPAPAHVRPGRRLALKPGTAMEVAGLPGARRKPLDIETTESGVVHHYSFELAPEKVFWISGVLQPPEPGGPFRGDGTWQLAPISDGSKSGYVVSATRGARAHQSDDTRLGLGGALFFAGIAIALSFVPYVGPTIWVIVMLMMVLVILGELGSGRAKAEVAKRVVAPDTTVAPAVRVAIPADGTASDDEAEREAVAAEERAAKSSRA
jgi:hypothetical protein